MKFTFEVNVKGDTTKAESFIQQVSDHLVEYIRQNNFIVESIDRKIAFSEEEQTAVPAEQPMENPMAEPEADVIPDMPMQAVGEKLKKLKEFYGIKKETKKEEYKVGDKVKIDSKMGGAFDVVITSIDNGIYTGKIDQKGTDFHNKIRKFREKDIKN